MILFNDDIPVVWYGRTISTVDTTGHSKSFEIIGPANCNSVEVKLSDGTRTSLPILGLASALLRGTAQLIK
jgi:hypothetical protein